MRSFAENGGEEPLPASIVNVSPRQAQEFAEQAARCRRLARATTDPAASKILVEMARDYAAGVAGLRDD